MTDMTAYHEALAQLAEQAEQSGAPRYVAAHCVSCGAWLLAGHRSGCWVGALEAAEASPTPVADALAHVNRVQADHENIAGWVQAGRELAALRKLADAVRSHGIGAELGQLRERRAS